MAGLAQAIASIRGEGWKVTRTDAGKWRVRQNDAEYLFDRAQLFGFAGKQDGPADPPPPDPNCAQSTCADRPYLAERVLRIIEQDPRAVSHLEVIDELVEHAGPNFARKSINFQDLQRRAGEDVPF